MKVSDNMKNDEKINELESRIEKLEKIERNRKIRNIILLSIYGAIIVALIVFVIVVYVKLKPYVEKIDSLKNIGGDIKTDTIIDGSGDFGDFSDFFGNFFNY